MAFVQYPIPNIEQTITKPIIVQVLEKIKRDIFFDRNTTMLFIDHTESTHEIGSTVSNKNSNDLLLDTTSKVVVTASEQILNDILMSSIVASDELDTVWSDDNIGMFLKPTRPRTEILLQLNYKASSKSEVNNWINNYYNRLAKGIVYTNADVAYEYTVPDECIAIFHAVWEAMEANNGYGIGLIDYISKHTTTSFDFKTNIIGKGASMVIREMLADISISVNNEVPEATRTEGGSYEATIEVSFKYDKPNIIYQKYPIYVHSNYINTSYFDIKRDRNTEARIVPRTTTGLLNNLLSLYGRHTIDVYTKDGIIYPGFDDAKLSHGTLGLSPLIQLQVGVDSEEPRLLLDLASLSNDIGIELHPELLPYMKVLGDYVFDYGRGAVCVSVFKNGVRLNPAKYELTEDMKVKSLYDLDLRGNYHVTITLLYSLELLAREAVSDLSKFGDLAASIIKCLHPKLTEVDLPIPDNPDAIPGVESTEVNINTLYKTLERLPTKLTYSGGREFLVNTIAVMS